MKNQGAIDTSQFRVRHDYGHSSLSFKDGGECKSPNEALADEQTLSPPTAIWRERPRAKTLPIAHAQIGWAWLNCPHPDQRIMDG